VQVGASGSVVVKTLRYNSDGPGIDSRCRRGFFFSVASDSSMCLGSNQSLKMSTRIILGVKAAGA